MIGVNPNTVERAAIVETEAHQDVVELRFDHLAVGGTAFLFLLVVMLLYWMYKKRQRNKAKTRRCR